MGDNAKETRCRLLQETVSGIRAHFFAGVSELLFQVCCGPLESFYFAFVNFLVLRPSRRSPGAHFLYLRRS